MTKEINRVDAVNGLLERLQQAQDMIAVLTASDAPAHPWGRVAHETLNGQVSAVLAEAESTVTSLNRKIEHMESEK